MAEIAALVIEVPSNTVTRKHNQTLNVGINFTYVGPTQRITFTAVVTQKTTWGDFDEIGSTKKAVYSDIPGSDTPNGWTIPVSGLPLAGVEPKTTAYGLKVKAQGTFGTVEAGNKSCLYVQAPAGIGFRVSIYGVPAFGSYQKWCCYYWNPGISDFVGDGKWYNSYDKIAFSNVQPGGYLVVFLMRDSTVSSQYTSPTFQAVNGGIYQYDVQLGRVTKIG